MSGVRCTQKDGTWELAHVRLENVTSGFLQKCRMLIFFQIIKLFNFSSKKYFHSPHILPIPLFIFTSLQKCTLSLGPVKHPWRFYWHFCSCIQGSLASCQKFKLGPLLHIFATEMDWNRLEVSRYVVRWECFYKVTFVFQKSQIQNPSSTMKWKVEFYILSPSSINWLQRYNCLHWSFEKHFFGVWMKFLKF